MSLSAARKAPAAAHNAADDKAKGDFCTSQRGHENIDNDTLNFGKHEGGRRVGEGILHDGHHDEAGSNEAVELDAVDMAGASAHGRGP